MFIQTALFIAHLQIQLGGLDYKQAKKKAAFNSTLHLN